VLLQAAKMGAKATKAVAAKNMARRADQLLAALEPEHKRDRWRASVSRPALRAPAHRGGSVEGVRFAGGSPVSTWPSTGARRSSCSG
jgi:hypothetical protein